MIFCADGLTGIKESISVAFSNTEYQRCIVHQVRNTLKYVSYKEKKEFAAYLKSIYLSGNEEQARQNLDAFSEKWTYPIRNWGSIFGELSIMFEERICY